MTLNCQLSIVNCQLVLTLIKPYFAVISPLNQNFCLTLYWKNCGRDQVYIWVVFGSYLPRVTFLS